jgi:hypothetical protein
MTTYPINFIIQLAGGFLGGNTLGNANKKFDLGVAGNSFVGIAGGTVVGHLLFQVGLHTAAKPDGIMVLGEAIVSALAGAALTALIGASKDRLAGGSLTFGATVSNGSPSLGRPKLLSGTTLPSSYKE